MRSAIALDFFLEGEVPGVEQDHFGVGHVGMVGVCAGGNEERIVLCPCGNPFRLTLSRPRLPSRVGRQVVLVVPQQRLHIVGTTRLVDDRPVGERLLGIDVLDVASPGLPLQSCAIQGEESPDGGLSGFPVLPPFLHRGESGTEAVGVGALPFWVRIPRIRVSCCSAIRKPTGEP